MRRGGSGTTNGNPVVGSNNVTTGTLGYAAGMDYRYSPDTVVGFALAGGGGWHSLKQTQTFLCIDAYAMKWSHSLRL